MRWEQADGESRRRENLNQPHNAATAGLTELSQANGSQHKESLPSCSLADRFHFVTGTALKLKFVLTASVFGLKISLCM